MSAAATIRTVARAAAACVLVIVAAVSGVNAAGDLGTMRGAVTMRSRTRSASVPPPSERTVTALLAPRVSVPDGTPIFDEVTLTPGIPVSRTVTVRGPLVPSMIGLRREGPRSKTTRGYGTGELGAGIQLTVQDEREQTWFLGSLVEFAGVTFCGGMLVSLDGPCAPWRPLESHRITLTLELPGTPGVNRYQGARSSFDLIWVAHAVTDVA